MRPCPAFRMLVLAALLLAPGGHGAEGDTALDRSIQAPDPSYSYRLIRTIPGNGVTTAVLEMTSQTWLTETEVENFARMQNVSDEVLRIIGTSRVWTKNYAVVSSLVKNPRTPTSVSLTMVSRLAERDVKMLTVNRNVPESVRLAARKQLEVLQSRKS